MKKFAAFAFIVIASTGMQAQNQNLLSGKYSVEQLKTILISQAQWTPFPKINDRAAWSKADQAMMKEFYEKGLTYINYDWPSIPATVSLLIERTGERAPYEAINTRKREVLGTLVLAEIY